METLERVDMRQRQVRYQAALRPDIHWFFILNHSTVRPATSQTPNLKTGPAIHEADSVVPS